MSVRRRVVIAGAAGRDFHNFNTVYRDDPGCEVVAFTATQIPGIAGRRYPAALAGPHYPEGIEILPEAELDALVRSRGVDEVVLAYSDLSHAQVMHLASRILAAGADFSVLGPRRTMLTAAVPVVAVSAVRTGAGKSPAVRWLSQRLRARGLRCAVVRHPMPYGDLASQAVQRFASHEDLDRAACTVEEREEYEPHLAIGNVVYAGIDYQRIIGRAASDADLLLWDGGNNDFPFVRPGLHIVLADALRPGDESTHHPGEACARMADVIVLSKCDSAPAAAVDALATACRALNPHAPIVRAALPIALERPDAVRGRRVLVIEDGPTLTHGGMAHGAGYLAAQRAGAQSVLDPRPFAVPEIAALYAQFPHIGRVLPAVGYSAGQLDALRRTIDATDAEVVVAATPADLARLLGIAKPVVRVRYEFQDLDSPGLWGSVEQFLASRGWAR